MPGFHAKSHGYNSYTTHCQYPGPGSTLKRPTIRLEGSRLFLPKLKDGVELVVHRPMPENAVIGNVTIGMETDGSLYASIEYSYTKMVDSSLREAALKNDVSYPEKLNIIGLDYSQKDFYVDSDGRKANYPHYYRRSEEKPGRLMRELSHMQKGSRNYLRKFARLRRSGNFR